MIKDAKDKKQKRSGFHKKVFIVFALFVGLAGCREDAEIKLGKKTPDFTLISVDGKKITLSSYFSSKTVILWFTNLCPGCRQNAPLLQKIYSQYKKKNVEFLAISQLGNDRKPVEDFIRDLKITFPFLIDPKGKVCKLYAGEYIPEVCPLYNFLIIGKTGLIQYRSHYPGISENELDEELKKFVAE